MLQVDNPGLQPVHRAASVVYSHPYVVTARAPRCSANLLSVNHFMASTASPSSLVDHLLYSCSKVALCVSISTRGAVPGERAGDDLALRS